MPCALQPLDDAEEVFDLLVRERGGRLVHDDDAGLDGQGARDGDEMPLRDREVLQPRRRVDDRRIDGGQERRGARVHGRPVDEAQARLLGAWPRKMFSATESSSKSTVS